MSLPLPLSFHVETPTCKNPSCGCRVASESSFCAGCWAQLSREAQRKIAKAQCTRNPRCVLRYVNRGIRELKKLTQEKHTSQERQNNAVSMPTSDRSAPAPAARPADRPRHNHVAGQHNRGRGVGA